MRNGKGRRNFIGEILLETIHTSRDRDATLPEFDAEGVFLFSFDVEFIEFRRDFDPDQLISATGRNSDADNLATMRCPPEFFINLALNDIFIAAQTVSVFEQFLDLKRCEISK